MPVAYLATTWKLQLPVFELSSSSMLNDMIGKQSVHLNELYFTTMVSNLLNNAVKYSRNTAVIHLAAFSDKKGGITVEVSDRGIGISRSQQKNIFDIFYRVGTGNIHSAKGLGLGLYYLKKITEAHGGSVSVSSKKGKGSVFIVNIP